MNRRLPVLPVLLGLLVALALPVALLVPVLAPAGPSASVLTARDRAALGGPDLGRGPDPTAPALLPAAPEAVARAYLVAAHAAGPDDAGRTRRDAVVLAEPGSPAAVGTPVLDPPGPGARRVAVVDGLVPAGTDPDRGRLAYLAAVHTVTARPGAAPRTERWRTRVVLHRDPGGRWRVAADAPVTPDTPGVGDRPGRGGR
ncbi:hypothetical protein ACLFMI_22045 [Pseudonocardia nantongensis]|uniref:hypothetical protein n=1 Tax=Pseudonocardia nantongensis TaxID=1181885 RepID=UPI0039785EF0